MKRIYIIVFFLSAVLNSAFAQTKIKDEINWNKFISANDLVFNKMPDKWEEAPYFGNGFIGSMIYRDTSAKNKIIIQVFRTDVHDHRGDTSGWTAYSRPRLLIGNFVISFKGDILKTSLRQNFYSADLSGSIHTTAGIISLHHYISANDDIIFTKFECKENEKYTLTWQAAEAKSTRTRLFPDDKRVIPKYAEAYGAKYKDLLKVYQPNPKSVIKQKENIALSVQNLLAGGQFAVAWKKQELSPSENLLFITIQNSYPAKVAEDRAFEIISKSSEKTYQQKYKQHRLWWSAFYQKSFMSIPDKSLERLYWLQMYKIGSANRANGPMMDTSGPWFQATPWPYITWDLNVQLCYWPLNVSNHLDLAMSLPNSLIKNEQQLIDNVKPDAWRSDAAYIALSTAHDLKGNADDDMRYKNLHSNLPWAMHNVWLMYKYSMDEDFLRNKCYPLLKRSINYYLHIIKKEKDGKYHIPLGYSPEYPVKGLAQPGESKDTNIDLALLKWGLDALLEASEILNLDKENRVYWEEVLANLAHFPTNENGFMIGADLPYTASHRHYSHLLMIYPLYLFNIDEKGNKELIEKSLKHWIGNPKGLQGYSYTGASSISAAIGNGNDALKYLKGLNRFLLPNGLYKESGPVFETPLSAAQSIHDMLLQSWGNKIRIFPAVPDEWKNIVFHKWLAEGAFEISAKLTNGETEFINIKSLAGTVCVFKSDIRNPQGFINGKRIELKQVAKDTYQVDLQKGQSVIVKTTVSKTYLSVGAVSAN